MFSPITKLKDFFRETLKGASEMASEKAKAQKELDKKLAEDKKAAAGYDAEANKPEKEFNMAQRPDQETQEQMSKREEKVNTIKEAIINMAKRYDSNTDIKLHAIRRLSNDGLELDFESVSDRSGEFFKAHQPEILEAVEDVCPDCEVSVEGKNKGMFTVTVKNSDET